MSSEKKICQFFVSFFVSDILPHLTSVKFNFPYALHYLMGATPVLAWNSMFI